MTLLCVLGCFCGCKQKNQSTVDDKSQQYYVNDKWSHYHEDFNESKTITVEKPKSEELTFKFEVGTVSGTLNVKITDEKGNVCYEGKELKTSIFEEKIKPPANLLLKQQAKIMKATSSLIGAKNDIL